MSDQTKRIRGLPVAAVLAAVRERRALAASMMEVVEDYIEKIADKPVGSLEQRAWLAVAQEMTDRFRTLAAKHAKGGEA